MNPTPEYVSLADLRESAMAHDKVVVTIQVPGWAGEYLETFFDHVLGEANCDLWKRDKESTIWVIQEEECQGGNSVAEEILQEWGIPYNKYWEAGSEFEAGNEWVRFNKPNVMMRREVLETDRPDFPGLIDERKRWIRQHSPQAANRMFTDCMIGWWEDHKPLEPPIEECEKTWKFLAKTEEEA